MTEVTSMLAHMRAWLATPEGERQMREAMEEVERETAWMVPGTSENYEYQRITREELDKYDRGSIY